jgi:hypothetical protein
MRPVPRRKSAIRSTPFSFIRTVTVGFGFAPNLLTLPVWGRQALAGLCFSHIPPVGISTPP